MTRLMYDAVTPANIPRDAQMVAGYVGGHWPTFPTLATLFPHAVRVSIAVNATENAMVLDVEQGDATPGDAPAWALRQRVMGGDPTVYCSTSVWPQVVAQFQHVNVALPHWWEAHYDGKPTLSAGSVAKQYTDGTLHGAPNNVPGTDTSIVADYWPGVDPKPSAPPVIGPSSPATPQPTSGDDDDMFVFSDPTGIYACIPGVGVVHVPDMNPDVTSLGGAAQVHPVDQAFGDAIRARDAQNHA